MTITDLPQDVLQALRELAIENRRTLEDELVAILEYELREPGGLGTELQALGRRFNLTSEELDMMFGSRAE